VRKLFAALVAFFLTIGLAIASDAVFVKFEDGKLTVTEDGKEATYKVGDKVKTGMFEKMKSGKTKLDITKDGETVTAVKSMKKKA
jgi:uncharacterized protein with FMN-binding domain